MREILFKGKRIDTGEWVEGFLFETQDNTYIAYDRQFDDDLLLSPKNIFIPIEKKTICQYTGLTDKNGNKIWENDVVNCPLEECCGKITWNDYEAMFVFDVLLEGGMFEEQHLYDFSNYLEVIGNIFDNPEILGGKE